MRRGRDGALGVPVVVSGCRFDVVVGGGRPGGIPRALLKTAWLNDVDIEGNPMIILACVVNCKYTLFRPDDGLPCCTDWEGQWDEDCCLGRRGHWCY